MYRKLRNAYSKQSRRSLVQWRWQAGMRGRDKRGKELTGDVVIPRFSMFPLTFHRSS